MEDAIYEVEEMVYMGERKGSRRNTIVAAGGMRDGKRDKLKVAYTNVDGVRCLSKSLA